MRWWSTVLVLLLFAGCEKGTPVEAAPQARIVDGKIVDTVAGVTIHVDPSRYVGAAGEGELLQLHVEVDNHSNRALRLGYDSFYLIAPGGRTWTSLDPTRFDLSSVGLRDDLLDKGISERIFETDNEIDGYIYFQDIDPDVRRVDLRVRLVDANTGARFGELSVPLVVYPEGGDRRVSQAAR